MHRRSLAASPIPRVVEPRAAADLLRRARARLCRTAFLAFLAPASAAAWGQGLELEGQRAHVVGRTPSAVALGDIDGDGDVDAVVGAFEASELSVLRNSGDGNFAPRDVYSTPQPTRGVALGDIDGDGDLDAVACGGTNVRVFANLGAGTFAQLSAYSTGSSARAPTLVDLEGDGDLDLILVNYGTTSRSVSFFHNPGNGVFASAGVVNFVTGVPCELAPADLDGDGDVDLAVSDEALGQVRFLMNQGGAVFSLAGTAIPVGPIARWIRAADFDQDGDADFAVATTAGSIPGEVTLLWNQGGGGFGSPVAMPAASAAFGLHVADLDGDGRLDIAASCALAGTISYFRNLGSGAFATQVPFRDGGVRPDALASADMDGDSDEDLVVVDSRGSTAIVLPNRGDGTFAPAWFMDMSASAGVVRAADVDGDTDLDIAIGVTNNGTMQLLTNQGDGQFVQSTPLSGISYYDMQLADIDADADVDLVATTYTGNQVVVHSNLGNGTFGAAAVYNLPFHPGGIDVGDVDADGDIDLAFTVTQFHTWRLGLNQGNGTFVLQPAVWSTPSDPWHIVLTDLDSDGDLDVAISAPGGVAVYFNTGAGTYSAPTVHAVALGTVGLCDVDIDTDGDIDLAVGDWSGEAIQVLVNDGSGSFAAPLSVPAGRSPRQIAAADLDLDGDSDLLVTNANHCVAALENLGGLQFAPPVLRPVGEGPTSVIAADLDGDGDSDVVTTSGQWVLALVRNASVSGAAVCAGDGSASACPCGNNSAPNSRNGCLNSLGFAGSLRASGSASLSDDQLELHAEGMPNSSALYFQGTLSVGGGAGSFFGDGLRCAGGTVLRLGTKLNSANASRYPEPGDPRVSVRGAVMAPGTRVVQVWYRNAASFCTAGTFNLTNGWVVTWRS